MKKKRKGHRRRSENEPDLETESATAPGRGGDLGHDLAGSARDLAGGRAPETGRDLVLGTERDLDHEIASVRARGIEKELDLGIGNGLNLETRSGLDPGTVNGLVRVAVILRVAPTETLKRRTTESHETIPLTFL